MVDDVHEYLRSLQVVVIAGGLGTRLRHITAKEMPKALIEVGGHALVEYCLHPFKKAGCDEFIFLLGHGGDGVKEYIEERGLVSKARYQVERERLGKGGAIKRALVEGIIDSSKPCITVFPDDLFLNHDLYLEMVNSHLRGAKLGCISTVAVVEKTKYSYGWVKTEPDGTVGYFEEKPWIPYPANTGMFIHEPKAYEYFDELIDLEKIPLDFESIVLPRLVEEKLLYSHKILLEDWIPINDEKEFRKAEKILKDHPIL